MRQFAILILIGASFLCTLAVAADVQFEKVNVDDRTVYIVPKEYAEPSDSFIRAQLGGSFTPDQWAKISFWTPSPEQAAEAEKAAKRFIEDGVKNPALAFPDVAARPEKFAPDALKSATKEIGLVHKDYDHYVRQFLGISFGDGKKIYCNYFFPEFPADFKIDTSRTFMCISDGGHTVWQVEYDLDSKKCFNLQINGPWE